MGAGLAGGPPCIPASQVFMGAGLAGGPPCIQPSQVFMGAGLAGGPPCIPQRKLTYTLLHVLPFIAVLSKI